MKVESTQEPVGFQPVTCKLTFTSDQELQIFRAMMSSNISLPVWVSDNTEYKRADVSHIMDLIRTNLNRLEFK